MKKKCIHINYQAWQKIPEVLQRILIGRIFKKYHFSSPPVGRMTEIEKIKCIRKGSTSKWYRYGYTATTFKNFPGIRFIFSPHQVVYFYFFGDPEGLQVQHKCGCPDCIEPSHLMLGTTGDNADHASATRKPDDINEGLKSWKTWPGDRMIMIHMRKILGLSQKQIGKVISIDTSSVSYYLTKIYENRTIFINKKWENQYTPPDSDELICWVKLILIRIKKNPELRSLFTLKDLQKMFFWTVDFDRTIAWYSKTMKDL
jgi:hypothetical protein